MTKDLIHDFSGVYINYFKTAEQNDSNNTCPSTQLPGRARSSTFDSHRTSHKPTGSIPAVLFPVYHDMTPSRSMAMEFPWNNHPHDRNIRPT